MSFVLLSSFSFLMLSNTISGSDPNYRNDLLHQGLPIINSTDEKDVLPVGFRMSKVAMLPSEYGLNFEGLAELNISGSSQFSEMSLDAIIKRVAKKHITIVNVHQKLWLLI